MLQRSVADSRTACALLIAIDEHEITFGEFIDAIEPLTPEALQVVATALRSCVVSDPASGRQLMRARTICSRLAAVTRVLS